MKSITTITLLGSLCISFLRADGIPVDRETNKVLIPHIIVSITPEQKEETQALGTFTLTTAQWKALRAKAPEMPKRFDEVIPVTWNDCTCGVEWPYVIQFPDDKMAILLGDGLAMNREEWSEQLYSDTGIGLRANERGEFFHDGKLVPFPTLLSALSSPPKSLSRDKNGKLFKPMTDEGYKYDSQFFLYVSLPVGAKPTDAIYATRLKKLAAIADRVGMNQHLMESW